MRVTSLLIHRSRLGGLVRLATATVLLIAYGVAMPARGESASADQDSPAATQTNELTNWNRIAASTLVAFPPAASGAPPALQINMAMTQGAVYDAVNAIDRGHRPYLSTVAS